jgi:serine/threonine protein kinase/formylglycine-generating enzyme required for sulfatase activity
MVLVSVRPFLILFGFQNMSNPSLDDNLSAADAPTLPPSVRIQDDATLPSGEASGASIHNPMVGDQNCFGDYELLEEIARGGMGVVFKARQIKLNRIVALKMILAGQLASELDIQRFLTEAEAAANLDHPRIVPIFEVGQHQGQHFFSMGYVDGTSLSQKIADGPLPPRDAAEMLVKICEGIAYAHDRGVIHRDLKPANILIDRAEQPKVTDFGLAKKVGADSNLTGTGQILGTPSYMAPEQASGKIDEVGPLADIYSLGAILYCLLTGRPPFQSSNPMDTLLQVLDKEPISPRQLNPIIPVDLETICLKCLSKETNRRYPHAKDLLEELGRFLRGEPILARPVSLWEHARRWAYRKPTIASLSILLGFTMITLAIGGPLVAWHQSHLRRQLEDVQQQRTYILIDSLLTANSKAVPSILAGIDQQRETAIPRLRALQRNSSLTPVQAARIQLALFPYDSTQIPKLSQFLLSVDPGEFLVTRDTLSSHSSEMLGDLWDVATSEEQSSEQKLRAACALAAYDSSNTKWEQIGSKVADTLVHQNSLSVADWVEALRPARQFLCNSLISFFRDSHPDRSTTRLQAAMILMEYAEPDVKLLTSLVADADDRQFDLLMSRLQGAEYLSALRRELASARAAAEAGAAEHDNRVATLAIACLRLGSNEEFWSLLERSSSPSVRSYLIHRSARLGVPAKTLWDRLRFQPSSGVVQAILLALGQYEKDAMIGVLGGDAVRELEELSDVAVDAGVRASVEWLIRHRFQQGREPQPLGSQSHRRLTESCFYTSQGHCMLRLPKTSIVLGSPLGEIGRREDEEERPFTLGYPLAMSAMEVTVAQFQVFLKENPSIKHNYVHSYSPTPDCPQTSVSWHDAAAYCNWLSEKEGLPPEEWCYRLVEETDSGPILATAPNFLERKGYRLPTESEWEYACRAGTRTVRTYGNHESLLTEYAWYQANASDRSWPVATKKPNDWGFFDMHGNVWEWCQDAADVKLGEQVSANEATREPRIVRGGSFFYHSIYIRSSLRNRELATSRFYGIGFRPVCGGGGP